VKEEMTNQEMESIYLPKSHINVKDLLKGLKTKMNRRELMAIKECLEEFPDVFYVLLVESIKELNLTLEDNLSE